MQDRKKGIAFCLVKEKIDSGRISDFEISSSSMFPFLKPGDMASVKRAKLQDLKKGDIIIYKRDDYLCVHRYIHPVRDFLFIAKGDNLPYFDQLPISAEQLVGKVIAVRKGKKVINLERASWKIINYLLASISAIQAYVPASLQFLRRVLLGNREFRPGICIKKGLCFIFSIPLKLIMYITRILP